MMPEDQYLQYQAPQNLLNKLKSLFSKKYALLIIMILTALILLIPLLIFIISSLKTQEKTKPVPAPVKKEFKPVGEYVPDQIIVKYKEKYTREEIINLKEKLDAIGVISQDKVFDSDDPLLKNFYLLKLKKGSDIVKIRNELVSMTEIEVAEPNYIKTTQEIPNDQYFSQLWGLQKIDMPSAWNISKGSSSIIVAVIDSGIDYNHNDLPTDIIKGPDYLNGDLDPMDDCGHGTHVSGTIGALANNGIGVSGVNWNIKLMALKVVGPMGKDCGGPDGLAGNAVRYAADNGADVINMSLGSNGPCSSHAIDQAAINYAISKGVTVVVAAGNFGKDANLYSPASCNGVVTVGASDQNDQRSIWSSERSSNWGGRVDIAAPGTDIISTWMGNKYARLNGTSMASPHVAGVAALLLSVNPNLSNVQVRDCLVNNADPILTDKPIGPRLNTFKTLSACSGVPPITPTASPTPTSTAPTATPTLPPGVTASPTPVPATPPSGSTLTPTRITTPTPTPIQTYTCREANPGEQASRDSIQIGNLICEPNP